LYSLSNDGHFVLNCIERNRPYSQRPDDSCVRVPHLQSGNTIQKATLELKLPCAGLRFSCQLVQRVTERWGIKFAGVALIKHPGGKLNTVYLPGVLTFDPAGITGDPHSSERVGPACDRLQVGITFTQLCILQHGGTYEDLDKVDAAFDEVIACFSGRCVLAAWMRHQVEQACLQKAQAKPYPVFIQDLIKNGALTVEPENRRVTKEYLRSFELGAPVVCEAYLDKVSKKDRGCFGRSCFDNTSKRSSVLASTSPQSDDESELISAIRSGRNSDARRSLSTESCSGKSRSGSLRWLRHFQVLSSCFPGCGHLRAHSPARLQTCR